MIHYFPVLILLLMSAGLSSQAQHPSVFNVDETATARTFFGGIAIGGNFSQVDGDGFDGYHKVGLNAGPLVYARIRNRIFGSLGIAYTQKGSKARFIAESANLGPGAEGYDLKLNYIEVPLLLHLILPTRFQFGGGVSYARLLRSDESAFSNGPVNLYPDINTFHQDDWSFLADGAFEFYKAWLIAFRFSYSLKPMRDGNRIPEGYGGGRFAGQFNNVCTLRVIYLIQ